MSVLDIWQIICKLFFKNIKTMITLFKDPLFDAFEKVFDTHYTHTPLTNIRKNETEYNLSICVPGLSKDDLKISTKEGVLKISYEKQENDEIKHFINSFSKSYTIPDDVKEKDIQGKVENGILELILPIDKKKSLERSISLN